MGRFYWPNPSKNKTKNKNENINLIIEFIQKQMCTLTWIGQYETNREINGIKLNDICFIEETLGTNRIDAYYLFKVYHKNTEYEATIDVENKRLLDDYKWVVVKEQGKLVIKIDNNSDDYYMTNFVLNHFSSDISVLDGNFLNMKINNLKASTTSEIWRIVDDYPNYKVSNKGRIKNTTGRISKGVINRDGNILASFTHNGKKVEKRLDMIIAVSFNQNPNEYTVVAHINDDKADNNAENLVFVQKRTLYKHLQSIDGEEWKIIKDNNSYEISSLGRVRNRHTGRIRKQHIRGGYNRLSLTKKSHTVNRLVAKAFITKNPENKLTVDHIDRNKPNNNATNLRWATAKEQCTNRIMPKKAFVSENRAIYRIDPNTNKKYLHKNMADAIEYVMTNNLGKGREESIRNNIRRQIGGYEYKPGKKIGLRYGFKWRYKYADDLKGEIWKSVKDIKPEANDMLISNCGRVKNPLGHLVSGYVCSEGYCLVYIGIKGKTSRVNRLVAKLFIPNNDPTKNLVNHKDGIKTNNHVSNLEWITTPENCQHAVDTGLNTNCKKTVIIDEITKKPVVYNSIMEASKKLGISYPKMRLIVNKK